MEKLSYQQAYDKVIDAYFKNELEPFKEEFCFCGNLCDNNTEWNIEGYRMPYTYREFKEMELQLLNTICLQTIGIWWKSPIAAPPGIPSLSPIVNHPNYEDALFNGMCAALEVLKEIHIKRGEVVDAPVFTKRNLKLQKI